MALLSVSFPQISRVNPARFLPGLVSWGSNTLLWLSLLIIISINIYAKTALHRSFSEIFPVLTAPFSSDTHLAYAQSLWSQRLIRQAKQEALIASDLHENDSVLGTSTDAKTLLLAWESEPIKTQQAFDTWKSITRSHPEYADGFLLTAVYAYQLGYKTEARDYITKAEVLNPQSSVIRQFHAIMK